MSAKCYELPYEKHCDDCQAHFPFNAECPAHKPEPDEAAESARTSGSPTAARSDSCGTTAVQLAPVLRPDVGADFTAAFHRHLDECSQCRNNPFGLCDVGAVLLRAAV